MRTIRLSSILVLGLGAALFTNCGGDTEKAPDSGTGGTTARGGTGGTGKGGSSGKGGGSSKGGSSGKGGSGGDSGEGGEGASTSDAGSGGSGATGGSTGGTGASAGVGGDNDGGTGNEGTTDYCTLPWSEPAANDACDLEALEDGGVVLSGDITADLTLEGNKSYVLSGPTRVMPGVKLTIEPCVKIMGDGPTSVLAVLAGDDGDNDPDTHGEPGPGGQIEAIGEADRPIVFTSKEPVGERQAGDWGGVILLGNGYVNSWDTLLDVPPTAEGLVAAQPYGWKTDAFNDDSSGTLRYVRIEFVGREITTDNETNGLTLGGVGSGTTLDHIMVSHSIDDCFEWFGGAVNANYLVASDCDDDMFDSDAGFSGKVQFAFGRQGDQTAETDPSGFEMDGKSPEYTSAQWSNVTLCGGRDQSNNIGMVLRKGLAGSIMNALVTGFETGLALRDGSSVSVSNTVLFDNAVPLGSIDSQSWFLEEQTGNSVDGPAGFCDCWAALPVPFFKKAPEGGEPTGFPVDDASYRGAFADASVEANWMNAPWVNFADD